MASDEVQTTQTQLLVTLAQALLVMHQTNYLPTRLREQLVRQVGELEGLTEEYARVLAQRHQHGEQYAQQSSLGRFLAAKFNDGSPTPKQGPMPPSLKLVEPSDPPPDPAA